MQRRKTSKESNFTPKRRSVQPRKDKEEVDKRKLLSSLNDVHDGLTMPSISEKKQVPGWLQQMMREDDVKAMY